MKCANHPETDAEALCTVCQVPICRECGVDLNGKFYCRRCLSEKVAGSNDTSRYRHAFPVLVLSLLPGAGYMYLGLMNRGLQAMLIFFGATIILPLARLGALTGIVVPVLVFYSIFDSLQLAARMREGIHVEDKPYFDTGNPNWMNILGYILVGIGVLGLLYNLVPYALIPFWIMDRLIPPLIIIAIGACILYRGLGRITRGGKNNDSTGQN